MNRVKTVLMLAMVLTAPTAVAFAETDAASSESDAINGYSKNAITCDSIGHRLRGFTCSTNIVL